MAYIIVNPSKKVYIRLNENGSPETCNKQQMQKFEHSKAKNLLDNLPKPLKRFHFRVECLPDEIVKEKQEELKQTQIITEHNKTSEEVLYWLDKIKNCNQLAVDASKRKAELEKAQSNIDKELSNCLHKIELEKHKNACDGYKEYDRVKIVLEKRRKIKDELIVVRSILSSNLESIATDKIQKVIDGLGNRVFEIR